MVNIKKLVFVLFLFLPLTVLAAESQPTEYFGALWDFIDWVFEVFTDIKQTIYDFLIEMGKAVFLLWLELKKDTLIFVWDFASGVIGTLNLSDIISSLFAGLSPDIQMFMTEIRLGEGLNMLLSAHLTRAILRLMGW